MPRTIIAIDPDVPNSLTMRLVKATQNIPDAKVHLPFACTPEAMPPWDNPEAVKDHGLTLLKELEKHPAVKQALQFALMTPAGQTSPVYFHLNEEIAEQLCWESLYSDEKSFLGLDARWPIGRIADSVLDRPSPPQEFSPPLKIAAILSALKRQAVEQWRGLRDAVVAVRANGLPVSMFVFVGEETLLADIMDEIGAGLQGVTVVPVPDRTADLERDLKAFGPHILHFFCHGSASHGVPRLEIATILDWMDGKTTGSLKLSIDDLQNMGALNEVWLVVLNCCESGRAEENTHSIAHMLVANVVPAAIGTLEPFDVSDADELCMGFYPLLFDELINSLQGAAGDGWVELEWATALRGARRSLSEKHDNDPSNHREWALPVLYVRPEPWLLKKSSVIAPAAPDMTDDTQLWTQKSEVVAGYLKALPPDADMEVRLAIFNVLAGAPDWLKPDLYGNFQGAEVNVVAPVVHEPLLQT